MHTYKHTYIDVCVFIHTYIIIYIHIHTCDIYVKHTCMVMVTTYAHYSIFIPYAYIHTYIRTTDVRIYVPSCIHSAHINNVYAYIHFYMNGPRQSSVDEELH